MKRLDGRRLLVVGASTGLGAAVVAAAAAEGAAVAGVARSGVDGVDGVQSIVGDVRDPVDCAAIVDRAVEALGGLVIFYARLAFGTTPGETIHVIGGLLLTVVYVAYQWHHWLRVAPFRPRLDYALGLLATLFMALALLSGLVLGLYWWEARMAASTAAKVAYPALLSAAHNIASMLVLAFVGSHLGAVLLRDRRAEE